MDVVPDWSTLVGGLQLAITDLISHLGGAYVDACSLPPSDVAAIIYMGVVITIATSGCPS